MQRPLKFRAWDAEKNRMVKDFVHDIRFQAVLEDKDENHWTDITVMQWMGLVDKNGKEIYEGDILQLGGVRMAEHINTPYSPLAEPDTRLIVEFTEGKFQCDEGDLSDVLTWHGSEIIGNIYENPELLSSNEKE